MCSVMDTIFKAGEMDMAKEMAVSLAEMGLSPELIAKAAKVDEEVVREWLCHSSESKR